MSLKIAVAQLNFVVGDMPGNARRIIDAAKAAYAQGARLLLTPELSICAYICEDLFLRPSFIAACDDAVKAVARETADLAGMAIVVGHPVGRGAQGKSVSVSQRTNSASVIRDGRVIENYAKRLLPNYQVFVPHEGRGRGLLRQQRVPRRRLDQARRIDHLRAQAVTMLAGTVFRHRV